MKKTVKTLALLFVSSLVMMSCGGVESDIEEACEKICAAQDLKTEEEVKKFKEENQDFADEMDEKYGDNGSASDEDKKAYKEGIKNCDCGDAK